VIPRAVPGSVTCVRTYPPDSRLAALVALAGAHIHLRNKSVRSSARYHRTPAQRSTHIRLWVLDGEDRAVPVGGRGRNGRATDAKTTAVPLVKSMSNKKFPRGTLFFRNVFCCYVWIHLSPFLGRVIGLIKTPMILVSQLHRAIYVCKQVSVNSINKEWKSKENWHASDLGIPVHTSFSRILTCLHGMGTGASGP
jgi:hypothetical protein